MSVNGKKLFVQPAADAGGLDFFGDGSGIAWYKLQGNLNDESGNYNATAPSTGPAEAYTTSIVKFGTQSFAPTGSGSTSNGGSFTTTIPTSKRTESFWVYQTARHNDDTIIFSLDIERESYNGVFLFDSCGSLASGIPNMSTGTWHHLVTSYNGSNTNRIYIDGNLGGTKTRNNCLLNRTNLITFSQGQDAPRTKLVNVRVFNREISAAEVTALYQETW
jgi:hypothetical protein